MKTNPRKVLGRGGSLLLGAIIGAAPLAQAQDVETRNVSSISLRMPVKGAAVNNLDPNRELIAFVQLDRPSVAEFRAAYTASVGRPPSPAAQRAHAASLKRQQANLQSMVRSLASKQLGAMQVAANGLRVRTTAANLASLRALPGVKSVAPVTLHTPDLSASVGWIGAPAVWDAHGDGTGITIAIIDTGIDYLHANFGGAGNVDDYNNNDFAIIEPDTFPTAKVIGGHDFAGPTYDASVEGSEPLPDPDPLDGNGHGTHVAGISAGNGVDGIIGAGVAKGASLYALKVFSDAGGSTDLTSAALEWALDPNQDGSMDDHVDVVNMSLGSPFGAPDDPTAIASNNAVANGIIVVASAGNSGNVPYVTGAPAVASEAISVASSLSGGVTTLALGISSSDTGVDGLHGAAEGAGPVTIFDSPELGDLVEAVSPADDGNGNPLPDVSDTQACHPLTNGGSMRGKIALVSRGTCTFDLKYINVQSAGAKAIVVHNDGADSGRVAPIPMGGIGNSGVPITIPGLMISSTAGFAVSDSLAGGNAAVATLNASLQVAADPALADTLSGFSSRGPGHGGSAFKPDVTAPGSSITSALAGSGNGPLTISGTSMSSPHVAGAAALLRSIYPDAQPRAIKAMLLNSSEPANVDGAGTDTPYPLARQGVGVVRVDRAASLTSVVYPATHSFGRINAATPVNMIRRAALVNNGNKAATYLVTHVPNQTMAGVTVHCPDELTVQPQAGRMVKLRIGVDPSAVPADDSSFSQSEVDGWCVLNNGTDTLRMGYMATVDAASRMRTVSTGQGQIRVMNNGAASGWAEGFTLAGIGGNEGQDLNHAIEAVGFRSADFDGSPVMEFGIALKGSWEAMSNVSFDVFIDVDEDGTEDTVLQTRDWSEYQGNIGTMVTGQFPLDGDGNPDLNAGFLDWFVSVGDYNDHVAAVPFSVDNTAGFSFLPEGDTRFNYRVVVYGRDGSTDSQTGSVDMSAEVVPDNNSFSVAPSGRVTVGGSQPGEMLWLFQNNSVGAQFNTAAMR